MKELRLSRLSIKTIPIDRRPKASKHLPGIRQHAHVHPRPTQIQTNMQRELPPLSIGETSRKRPGHPVG
jgi:hypothetical protein